MSKLERFFLQAALAIFTGIVGLYAYWSLRPYNVLIHQVTPFEVIEKELSPGENLQFKIKMCKNMDYEAHVQGQFINHTIIFLPEETFDLPTGCWEKTITKGLPDVMPSGVYYYSETVEYEVNPIRTIKYRFESEEFTVSK